MAVIERPKAADEFIGSAPDAKKPIRAHGKQVAISLALPRELLDRADAMAKELCISRAAFIKLALHRLISAEEKM